MKPFFTLIGLLFLLSCEKENLEAIRAANSTENLPCKNENISYQNDIAPILKSECYRCHDTENSNFFGNGVNLEGYDNVKLYLDAMGTAPDEKFIYGNAARVPGFKPMPMGDDPIDDCSLQKLRIWIEEGYLNN